MTEAVETKVDFYVKDMFGVNDYSGIHYDKLFPALIKDETITFTSGFTNLRVRYHSKNGFTGSQLLFLFTRQHEHEMAEDDDVIENSFQDVVDEKDMEGKWKSFANDEVRDSFCGQQLEGFQYDTMTKTITDFGSS